jgi:murein DD-endopeptidase MepM/ murein hydrolase activator NlpD
MGAALTRPAVGWMIGAAAAGFVAGALTVSLPRGEAAARSRQREQEASPVTAVAPRIEADPAAELRSRHLTVPVAGLQPEDLRDTFADERGGNRIHEALDILAPRNTPVVAVEDGRVAKLFTSKPGGLTIYQFDPTSAFAYYYAHLERYADGLKDGDRLQRGQVIGYVGTSGNAPPDVPHLHFAIFKLTDEKRWWQGTALDPYPILR